MEQFAQSLYHKMELLLADIFVGDGDPIHFSERSIACVAEHLTTLEKYVENRVFENLDEEMSFFRDLKPMFLKQIIYYSRIYDVEINKPIGSRDDIFKYYLNQQRKLYKYIKRDFEFYKYINGTDRSFDAYYFCFAKNKHTYNPQFVSGKHSTVLGSFDYRLARFQAAEMLNDYFNGYTFENPQKYRALAKPMHAKWTGSKTSLVELIYALDTAKVFDHGNIELHEIAKIISEVFDVDLGQYHKTFFEIRVRKSERTKFLNSLKDGLISRMEMADEF